MMIDGFRILSIARFVLGASATSILALSLNGCAHAKTTNKEQFKPLPNAPVMVYVGTFDLGASVVQSDPGTLTGRPRLLNFRQKDPAEELQKLSAAMRSRIVDDLHDAHLPAETVDDLSTSVHHGWLVTGEFLEIGEGNRLQKAVIGFGAGDSDTKLFVNVRDFARPGGDDLINFNVDSQGDKAPGGGVAAVATHSPWGMAAKFALDRNASEKDVKRAADEVAKQIVALAKTAQ